MKQFLIRVHSEDTECIVTAINEDDAIDKFNGGEIDEWLTAENEQSDITAELYEESGD